MGLCPHMSHPTWSTGRLRVRGLVWPHMGDWHGMQEMVRNTAGIPNLVRWNVLEVTGKGQEKTSSG